MNRFERRVRNLVNPYSTAFASWWCHTARYMVMPGHRPAARSRRAGSATPGANRATPQVRDIQIATQASRRAALDEVLASLDDEGGNCA
jgi:hypothetical protein